MNRIASSPPSIARRGRRIAAARALGLLLPLWLGQSMAQDLLVSSRRLGPFLVTRHKGTTGALMGDFVTPSSVSVPRFMTFGPDGHLYASSLGTDTVIRYNGNTGALLGEFIPAGLGGLAGPAGILFGPDGRLYVAEEVTQS